MLDAHVEKEGAWWTKKSVRGQFTQEANWWALRCDHRCNVVVKSEVALRKHVVMYHFQEKDGKWFSENEIQLKSDNPLNLH